ncbi:MAG TPA: hypothetical protein VG897_03855 [Terriglobales bacterium]|nr:hypothetical protein [Terriglobales bacterium]
MLKLKGCAGRAHERFAAFAKRVDSRIASALQLGDLRPCAPSLGLQALVRKAAARETQQLPLSLATGVP